MKKHELLVPAGDMECLYQAVHNGCDAVYLACKEFGARKFAKNFTNDEIIQAIRFCHLYGVRIYVTMNTLVKDNEVESFISQVRFLHKNGIDAIIVQDFGMICYLREMFPNLEIHASTQANICSKDICELYYHIGVKRVVFARELSLSQIDSIDVPIEKEAFIHGALCISYSGCCLMSSMLGGRSGNRGECAGVCRMPFALEKDGYIIRNNQYLLSTKELNTMRSFNQLLNSSIDSFKIEGRMKSPFYVGFITRLYRRLIDGEYVDLEESERQLKTIFNREFTRGRILGENDYGLMNTKTPNHVGLEIGKVVDISNHQIKISLSSSLHQGDAIRFSPSNLGFIVNYLYDQDGKLTSSAKNICYVDNKVDLKSLDSVYKTQDYLLEKEFERISPKKIPISIEVIAQVGQELKITFFDGVHQITEKGFIVEMANQYPITKESIREHLIKLGSSPFLCVDFSIDVGENAFIPIRILNEMRRRLVQKLIEERENEKISFLEKKVLFNRTGIHNSSREIHVRVFTEEQLKTCLSLGVHRVYAPKNLYEDYQNDSRVFLDVLRCSFEPSSLLKDRNLVSDYLNHFSFTVVGNYPLNVSNSYTAYYLRKFGLSSLCLSVELTESDIKSFISRFESLFGYYSFEIFSYGRVENMIIKGNVLNLLENDYSYYLVDSKKRKFPVYYDGRITHILHCTKQHVDYGIGDIRIDFYDESSDEVEKIVKKYQEV